MKLYRFLLALPLANILGGCAPVDSLNPLYTDQDVVFDETLLGQWGTETEGLNFAKLGDNGYRIVMSGKDDETGQITAMVFDAHLVSMQGHRFLDVVCRESGSLNDSQRVSEAHIMRSATGLKAEPRLVAVGWGTYLELLPGESDGDDDRFGVRGRQAHEFFKVVMEDGGTTLKLVQLDDSWVNGQIQDNKLAIDHEIVEGHSSVLTAGTPDLQQLVLDHVDDEEAFKGETIAKRPEPESQQ